MFAAGPAAPLGRLQSLKPYPFFFYSAPWRLFAQQQSGWRRSLPFAERAANECACPRISLIVQQLYQLMKPVNEELTIS
jgi:hypothetical protein